MKSPARRQEFYRVEIARWARALSTGRERVLSKVLAPGYSQSHLALFVEGNFEKRAALLLKELQFVGTAFDNFRGLVWAYVEEIPLAAYGDPTDDCEQFLRWLKKQQKLTTIQRDFVICQRARHAVEFQARRKRFGHQRFQELSSRAGKLAVDLGAKSRLLICLNPIRVWARFHSAALLEGGQPPARVLFYPIAEAVTTAILQRRAQLLVRELMQIGPCRLDSLAGRSWHGRREELQALCHDLAENGLLAFQQECP